MKGGTSLGSCSSQFPQGSSIFCLVSFEVLLVSRCPIGSSLLELLSCELSEVSPELDLVDRLEFRLFGFGEYCTLHVVVCRRC